MSIFGDFGGSLAAGKFYHDILARPTKSGWALYIILTLVCAAVLTLYWGFRISFLYNDIEDFYLSHGKIVEFVDGKIVNMPMTHKKLHYKGFTILVDRKYIDLDSVRVDMDSAKTPILFIGPEAAFLAVRDGPKEMAYPSTFTNKIDSAYLARVKSMFLTAVFLGGFAIWLIAKFIESMLYILLIIAPILLFKFRRMGLTYGEGFKIGLYLITYEIILSTLFVVIGFTYIWIPLLFVLFYIFFIGGFVNIDLTHSKRQLYQSTGDQ